jgi:hypothetical protein
MFKMVLSAACFALVTWRARNYIWKSRKKELISLLSNPIIMQSLLYVHMHAHIVTTGCWLNMRSAP